MQTDAVFGFAVEKGDLIVTDVHGPVEVKDVNDDSDDFLVISCLSDEGEYVEVRIGAFESVKIVTSFEDDITVEDIEVDI